MDTTVIVALPRVDDRVVKVSSEVAHLTLCFLGETSKIQNLEEIVTFVQHAASQLSPFGLSVDYRGELGPDNADVLFFKKDSWSFPRISSFRGHLLQDNNIQSAYVSVDQYPEWTPHLTLGYPTKPAHADDFEYGLHYVDFDRIAIWTSNDSGPEFRLKDMEDTMAEAGMAAAWGALSTTEKGALAATTMFKNDPKAAKQYGVKGMQWGVTRKDRAAERTSSNVTVTQPKPGKFAKTVGGKGLPLHPDSKDALVVKQKAKASTTDSLSNAELRTAVQRMQLEQQYTQLAFATDRRSAGARFVAGLFGQGRYSNGKLKFKDVNEEQGKQVGSAIKKVAASKAVKVVAKAAVA